MVSDEIKSQDEFPIAWAMVLILTQFWWVGGTYTYDARQILTAAGLRHREIELGWHGDVGGEGQ